jgi:membrane protease YdiL (CAAX protease family)
MKAKAVIEVIIVFSLTLFLMALIIVSSIGQWERRTLDYPYIEYTVMIVFPLLILVAARRDLFAYGLSGRDFRYHMSMTATAIGPVVIAQIPLAFFNYRQASGALVMAAVNLALLFALGWLLKRKPTRKESSAMVGAVFLLAGSRLTEQSAFGHAISGFIFYIFFLGLGEELLFRGYIQSRLNIAWGRPFQFFGVNWGWGIILTSLIFGLMHVINIYSLTTGHWQPELWWGFWTIFGGLVLGFVREKTGNIFASTVLHGLPQAIYSAFPAP